MSSTQQSSALAGKIWMVVMGLFLVILGGGFVFYLWKFYQRSASMDRWMEVPCIITESGVDDSELTQRYAKKFTLISKYSYQIGDKPYLGTRYRRIQPAGAYENKIRSLQESLPLGLSTVCYVDPDHPENAVLKRDTKASLYSIWFPCLFILGGLGMIVSVFRSKSNS